MVVRGWGAAAATAVGAAAAASAAQLGLAYGMDVISWPAATGETAADAWTTGLTWAGWIAASSTIAGAIVAERVTRAVAEPAGPASPGAGAQALTRLVVALAAAVGAAATVVLIAVPARVAEVAGVTDPQPAAAGYALLGVIVGAVLAVAALTARAVAANLLATAAWLWLLAIAVVVDGVLTGPEWSRVPLGFFDLPVEGPWLRNLLLLDAGVPLAAALLVGALAALLAARRGDPPVGVAVSGAAGPLVVAAAYLLAQPDLTAVAAVDLSRQLAVPYLVLAGLAGSLLVAVVRAGRGDREAAPGGDEPAGTVPAARRQPSSEEVSV